MSLPLLIDPEEVLDALGQNPDLLEGSIPSLTSAIIRATIKLEAVLGTSIRPESRVDMFCVDGSNGGPINQCYSLMLTNGCVNQTPVPEVTVSDSISGTYAPVSNFVQYEQGKVLIPLTSLYEGSGWSGVPSRVVQTIGPGAQNARFVKVSYTSGYNESGKIPEELKQAMLCFVPMLLLSSSAATLEAKQQSAAMSKAGALEAIGADLAPRFIRFRGGSYRPMHSTKV